MRAQLGVRIPAPQPIAERCGKLGLELGHPKVGSARFADPSNAGDGSSAIMGGHGNARKGPPAPSGTLPTCTPVHHGYALKTDA